MTDKRSFIFEGEHHMTHESWTGGVLVSWCACGRGAPYREMISHYASPEDALRGDARTNMRDDASTPETSLSGDPSTPQGTSFGCDDPAFPNETVVPLVSSRVDFERMIQLARLARDEDGYPVGVTLTTGEYFALQELDSYVADEIDDYKDREGRPHYSFWVIAAILFVVSLWLVNEYYS